MNPENPSNKDFLLIQGVSPETNKLYKKRWLILSLYILYAAINALQWFEYSIIANIIMRFYNISAVAVDWTSIIYMALYMPMVVPASYIMEKLDLRQIAVIGVLGTALGTTVKIFSLSSDRIWVVYLGQTILSSMQVFILALPPRIAAVWFGPKEVSLACALGVFGTQLGQAIGFVVPPIVVKNHDDIDQIGEELAVLTRSLAVFTILVTAAVLASKPPTPPNHIVCEGGESFTKSLKKLLGDKSFNFHAIAYGINIAVFTSVSTLLNQFMLSFFPKSEEDTGRIGLIMVILGMVGAIAFGFILDRTHAYKTTNLAIYVLSLASVVAFMFSLKSGTIISVYISGALFGLFTNAYIPVGLELAVELTYPQPESTSSGILMSMTQTLGVIFTLLLGRLFSKFGCFWALGSMVLFLFIGVFLTAMIANVTKRQNAFKRRNRNKTFEL